MEKKDKRLQDASQRENSLRLVTSKILPSSYPSTRQSAWTPPPPPKVCSVLRRRGMLVFYRVLGYLPKPPR